MTVYTYSFALHSFPPWLSQDTEHSSLCATGRPCCSLRGLVWCAQPAGCVGQRMAFPFPGGGRPVGAKGPVKHHRCDERRGVESTSSVPDPCRPEVLAVSLRTQWSRCRGHSCEFPRTPCFQGGHRAPHLPGMSCFITDASCGLQAWAAMRSPGTPGCQLSRDEGLGRWLQGQRWLEHPGSPGGQLAKEEAGLLPGSCEDPHSVLPGPHGLLGLTVLSRGPRGHPQAREEQSTEEK